MAFENNAQRLLNHFRGVMNIIEYQGAEALTTDGIPWDICVRDTGFVENIANNLKVQTSDISGCRQCCQGPLYRQCTYGAGCEYQGMFPAGQGHDDQ